MLVFVHTYQHANPSINILEFDQYYIKKLNILHSDQFV